MHSDFGILGNSDRKMHIWFIICTTVFGFVACENNEYTLRLFTISIQSFISFADKPQVDPNLIQNGGRGGIYLSKIWPLHKQHYYKNATGWVKTAWIGKNNFI